MKELDTIKQMVEEILAKDIRARNNDLWLTICIWKKQKINCFIPYDKLNIMISPETVRRTRQIIQNVEKRYLPTDPVILKRRLREKQIKEWLAFPYYKKFANNE